MRRSNPDQSGGGAADFTGFPCVNFQF